MIPPEATTTNTHARRLAALHVPGTPLVLANVYDAMTAHIVGSLPACRALATASFAIARAAGLTDPELDLPTNLAGVRAVIAVARSLDLPVTADLQDGYGDALDAAVRAVVVDAGAAGINLEDASAVEVLYAVDVAADRIRRALGVARECGVPDFVINARCDALLYGGDVDEVIRRGSAYLDAGATCVFVWGAAKRGGISRDEVVRLSEAFRGRLAVSMLMPEGEGLRVEELARIGVCRISVGPKLQNLAMETYRREAEKILK